MEAIKTPKYFLLKNILCLLIEFKNTISLHNAVKWNFTFFIKVFHSKNKKWTFYFCPFFESYPRSF